MQPKEEQLMTENQEAPIIPADGIEFELALAATDPMQMVQGDGHDQRGWRFNGSQIAPQSRYFQLVRVDYSRDLTYSRNLGEILELLKRYGNIPEGQWRDSFKRAFPRYDGKGPIGFADPSWVSPGGGDRFPALFGYDDGWHSDFVWADGCRSNRWRWLVASGRAA